MASLSFCPISFSVSLWPMGWFRALFCCRPDAPDNGKKSEGRASTKPSPLGPRLSSSLNSRSTYVSPIEHPTATQHGQKSGAPDAYTGSSVGQRGDWAGAYRYHADWQPPDSGIEISGDFPFSRTEATTTGIYRPSTKPSPPGPWLSSSLNPPSTYVPSIEHPTATLHGQVSGAPVARTGSAGQREDWAGAYRYVSSTAHPSATLHGQVSGAPAARTGSSACQREDWAGAYRYVQSPTEYPTAALHGQVTGAPNARTESSAGQREDWAGAHRYRVDQPPDSRIENNDYFYRFPTEARTSGDSNAISRRSSIDTGPSALLRGDRVGGNHTDEPLVPFASISDETAIRHHDEQVSNFPDAGTKHVTDNPPELMTEIGSSRSRSGESAMHSAVTQLGQHEGDNERRTIDGPLQPVSSTDVGRDEHALAGALDASIESGVGDFARACASSVTAPSSPFTSHLPYPAPSSTAASGVCSTQLEYDSLGTQGNVCEESSASFPPITEESTGGGEQGVDAPYMTIGSCGESPSHDLMRAPKGQARSQPTTAWPSPLTQASSSACYTQCVDEIRGPHSDKASRPTHPAVEHLAPPATGDFARDTVNSSTGCSLSSPLQPSRAVPVAMPMDGISPSRTVTRPSGSRTTPDHPITSNNDLKDNWFDGDNWQVGSIGINNVKGNYIVGSDQSDSRWEAFYMKTASSAFHTANAVSALGICDPGTRVKALNKIEEWAAVPRVTPHSPNLLCMTGAAGSGKTAIALTIARRLKERGVLAASFFFSSMGDTRSDLSRLVPSIAYQLGLWNRSFRKLVCDAAAQAPHIFEASLEEQVTELIVKPLELLGGIAPVVIPHIVLIDAIDECQGEEQRHRLVSLMTNTSLWDSTRFRFFCTTRPEVAYATADRLSDCIRLSDDEEFDANEDIRASLRIHLSKHVGSQVPESTLEENIDVIARASSGQYIYPATTIKFVSEGIRDSPVRRLKIIVDWIRNPLHSALPTPLRRLDELYEKILTRALVEYAANPLHEGGTPKHPMILLLQAFTLLEIKTLLQSQTEVGAVHDRILGLDDGSFNMAVYDVRCLVRVRELTESGRILQFYHRTCLEFLQTRAKGKKDLHYDKERIDQYLLKRLCAVFTLSADNALALITSKQGVFTDNEKAWTNCTSVFLLGGLLRSNLSQASPKEGQVQWTLRTKDRDRLNRFFTTRNMGWEKLKDWVLLARKYQQLREDGSVKAAIADWGQYLDTLLRYQDSDNIRDVKAILDAMKND